MGSLKGTRAAFGSSVANYDISSNMRGTCMNDVSKVRAYIVENFLYGEEGRITEETSFLGSSIIDSTGVLELVNYLEETFNIRIQDDEIVPENLDSLINIKPYSEEKSRNGAT